VSPIKKTTFITCRFPGEHLATGSLQIGERADMDNRPGPPRIAWIAMRWKAGPGFKDAATLQRMAYKELFEQANVQ
jgi:hypothetical protein